MISQATRSLTRSCLTVGNLQHLQKRLLKDSGTKKRCVEGPKKSRKLLTAATIAVIGTAAAVVAAKNDDDFREWARENLPVLDSLVKVAYQEEETYLESIVSAHKKLSEWIKKVLSDSVKGRSSKQPEKIGSAKEEACEEVKKPYRPPESAFAVKEEKKTDGETSTVKTDQRYIKELKNLEEKLGHTAEDIIQSYAAVVCAMKEITNSIDNLDQHVSKHDCKTWEKLDKKMRDSEKDLKKAETEMKTFETTVVKLKSRLENDQSLTEDMKAKAETNLNIVKNDIKIAKENFEKEKAKSNLTKRSWEKVRKARMHFSEELETLFPNIWLNDEKLNLPLDSLGPFIQSVVDNIIYLDKELAKLLTLKDAETSSAIETFRSTNDPEGLVSASVALEGGKEKRRLQAEMQKALLTHQAKCEKNARAAMKQQAEVYKDLKAEALSIKEREVERKMSQQLEEELSNLRAQHKLEMAKMVGRIQGANEAIASQGDKAKGQQEKQQFWSAAQSLLSAIKPFGVSAKQQEPKPLRNEIANVSKAAPEGDELVESLLESIPQQAIERGVESEEVLKQRFLTVEKEARKVAAVPEGEVTLIQLFVARLQSALYFTEPIPQNELDNQPFRSDLLNNYEILYRARYYVDKGEFDQAVRYLNLLQGPSQKVAGDWVKDVVMYLETCQAAEALMAHAST